MHKIHLEIFFVPLLPYRSAKNALDKKYILTYTDEVNTYFVYQHRSVYIYGGHYFKNI
jgi:hypothetical protein